MRACIDVKDESELWFNREPVQSSESSASVINEEEEEEEEKSDEDQGS